MAINSKWAFICHTWHFTTEAHWYQGSYIKVSGYRHLKVSGGRYLKVSGYRHFKVSGGRHLKVSGGRHFFYTF